MKASLKTAEEFSAVFKKHNKKHTSAVGVLYKKNNINQARLGIVVSKKRLKRSVDRNVFKRVCRESFRQLVDSPLDVILLANKGIKNVGKKELRLCVDKLLNSLT